MFLKIYEFDPEKFLSARGLAWQAALKNANNKYMKGYDKNKESSYLKY